MMMSYFSKCSHCSVIFFVFIRQMPALITEQAHNFFMYSERLFASTPSPLVRQSSGAIVLLHGFLGHRKTWFTVAKRLHAHFPTSDVWAVDFRNHGSATHVPSHTIHDIRNDLKVFLENEVLMDPCIARNALHDNRTPHELPPITLVGHSMGSLAACSLLLHEERLQMRASRSFDGGVMGTSSQLLQRVKSLVSIDMPPLVGDESDLPMALINVLEETCNAMLRVRLHVIEDVRSATKELDVAGCPNDPQLRSFLLTNLVFPKKKRNGGGDSLPAAWKPNIHVLSKSIRHIFLSPECVDRQPGAIRSDVLIRVPVLAMMGGRSPLLSHPDLTRMTSSSSASASPSLLAVPNREEMVQHYAQTKRSAFQAKWKSLMSDDSLLEWSEIDGAGHNVHYDAMDAFVNETSKFLERHHR